MGSSFARNLSLHSRVLLLVRILSDDRDNRLKPEACV